MIEVPRSLEFANLVDVYRQSVPLAAAIASQREIGATAVIEQGRLDELQASLGETVLGRRVIVSQIDKSGDTEPPIERHVEINELSPGADKIEYYRSIGERRYGAAAHSWNPSRVRGKVVKIDLESGHLVVRPRGLAGFMERYWVKVLNDGDETRAVNVQFKDKR